MQDDRGCQKREHWQQSFKKMDKLVLENAKKVILNPPEETRTKEIKRTDVYKTLNIKTRKIEIAS